MTADEKVRTDIAIAWIRSEISDSESRKLIARLDSGERYYKVARSLVELRYGR